ncbi:MAG: S-layer homology domain-containing protein, partial [Clostridia bacterium]|nr:S-layer homology domain-containing protein [Clostridia bacterium]
DYRPADESAFINPTTGQLASPLGITDDSNCSLVLVDIMADGTAKLRRMDVAQGEYWFENEPLTVRPSVLTDYINDTTSDAFELSYGAGSKAPSMPKGGKVTLTDKENFGSVAVSFPEGVPASELSKDFIAEYRIRVVDSEGNYVMNGDKEYFSVANYRAKDDEGKPWSVTINGLEWDTDYTAEVKMITPYGKSTEWIKSEDFVSVGHPEITYPAVPVYDFDYSYGSAEDGTGHKMATKPTVVKESAVDGQKAVLLTGLGKTAYSYELYEEDFERIRNAFTMEAYFYATNVKNEQCIMGGTWDGSRLGLRLNEGVLSLRSSFMKTPGGGTSTDEVRVNVEANTWYHVVVTYDTDTVRMYLDGKLCAELSDVVGGLTDVTFGETLSEYFCVGSGGYGADEETMYMMNNCTINKAALYAGCMTTEDVANAYKVATTAVPFTDVQDGWYIDSVEYAYATGLMNGSSATTFSPSVKTNRAMIVQMLYNLEGKPAVDKSNNPFTDVPDTWYTDAVLWAYQSGVTTGTSATTFSPDALVTREQVAVFLYRYMRDYKKADMGEGADLSVFPDADKISPYTDFAPAMAWANANGIIGGKKNGSDV